MTKPACATRIGKIAKTEALWRAPLQAAQPACVACKEPLFALDQAHLTHVFAMGLGKTTALRCESNGPALQFKPGGT